MRLLKIAIWFMPVVFLIWVLNMNFSPSGIFVVTYDPAEENNFVNNFASKEPNTLIGTENRGSSDTFQLITQSPLYFDVVVPRLFPKATIAMEYKNPDKQSVINVGVKQADGGYYFKEFANFSAQLQNLNDYWHEYRSGDIVLFQRDPYRYGKVSDLAARYDNKLDNLIKKTGGTAETLTGDAKYSFVNGQNELDKWYGEQLALVETKPYIFEYTGVDDFLNNPPDFNRVVRHNFKLSDFLTLPGYVDLETPSFITSSIRGAHEIYTYLGDGENLDFTFTIQDANRHDGADPFTVTVYNSSDEIVYSESVADDGETHANGNILPERTLRVLVEDIPFGIYRLQVDIANDDVFIKRIESQQSLIVFKGHVYLTDSNEYQTILGERKFPATTLYTNSSSISSRTAHNAGLQTLRVGSDFVSMTDRHVDYMLSGLLGVTQIVSPLNDVKIEGDGYFAFSEDQFFDPEGLFTSKIDSVPDVDAYDFIIAHYPEPITIDGWLYSEATIEVPYLYFGAGNEYVTELLFTMPGLPEDGKQLMVKSVSVIFEKEPITINNLFTRLMNFL